MKGEKFYNRAFRFFYIEMQGDRHRITIHKKNSQNAYLTTYPMGVYSDAVNKFDVKDVCWNMQTQGER